MEAPQPGFEEAARQACDRPSRPPSDELTAGSRFDGPWRPPVGGADDRALGLVVLTALAAAICFHGIGDGPPLGDHECIHAQCARQAIESGTWVIPYFNELPRLNKPPLGTWLIAVSALLLDPGGLERPVSELAARFPQALAGLLNVLVVCWLGTQMFGRRAGLVAGFIMATSVTTLYFSHSALIEMSLVLFTTVSFACFWRATSGRRIEWPWLLGFYVSFAGAMMCKLPLPLALIGMPIAIYWVLARAVLAEPYVSRDDAALRGGVAARLWYQIRTIPHLWLVPGLMVFVILSGAWPVYALSRIDGVLDLWRTEFLDRFSGEMSNEAQAWWYYLPIMFGMATPFLLSLPEAIIAPFLGRYRSFRHPLVYLFLWAVVGLVFLSTSSFKRVHYVTSVMPAFVLMLAPVIDRLFLGEDIRSETTVKITCHCLLAVILGGLIAGLVFANRYVPEAFSACLYAAVFLAGLWGGACLSFRYGCRATSLALLCLGSWVVMVFGWQAAASLIRTDAEAVEMAERFQRLGLSPQDRIVWVDSRVDATTAYYGHLRIGRLFSPTEISGLRRGRQRIPEEVLAEAADRMRAGLLSNPPTYYIMQAEIVDRYGHRFDLPGEEKFRLGGMKVNPLDDLVIIGPAVDREPTTQATPQAPAALRSD